MELAVVDSFVRSEPSKGASRSAEVSSVSFSDVLDATDRREQASGRAADRAADRAASSNAPSPEAPPRSDELRPAKADEKSAAPAAQTRRNSKSETAPESAESPEANASEQPAAGKDAADGDVASVPPAADGAPEEPPITGKGTAALDLIAALLGAGGSEIDLSTPKGQLIAAVVVPQNVPEHAAAAGNHSIPGLSAPAAPPAAPANTNAAPTPVAPPSDATTPALEATAPAPVSGISTPTPAATPVEAPGTSTPTPTTAPISATSPTPTPTLDETQVAEAVTAAPAAATTAPAATPDTVDDIVAQVAADLDALPLDATAPGDTAQPSTPTTTSGSGATGARPAASQMPSSGYFAQVVSQEASDDALMVPAPEIDEKFALASNRTEPVLAEAPAQTDDAAAIAKPVDMATIAAADAGTRETQSIEGVTAARGARPPVMPVPEQIVVRIAKAVADGVDRINVKLSPAELGHIDVRMEIGPDGRFQAVFAADRPQTVELLQRDARELARALQDAGLRADTGSLSFNLRGQGQHGNADSAPARSGSLPLAAGGEELPSDALPLPVYRATGPGAGRVDIRV